MNKILVDDREPKKIFDLLSKRNIDFEKTRLLVGDLVLGVACVERKEFSDFVSSILDGRIFKQVENMINNFPKSLIIISGKYDFFNSHLPLKVILAAIASIIARNNISIVSVENDSQLITLANLFLLKSNDGKEKDADFNIKKTTHYYNITLDILCALPGIGIGRAKKIFSKYDNIFELCNTTVEELSTVDGISSKLSTKILKSLGV